MDFYPNLLSLYLVNVKFAKLKERIVNAAVMKYYSCMIIKMCSIVLNAIFAIIENAEEFWDICVDMNNFFILFYKYN